MSDDLPSAESKPLVLLDVAALDPDQAARAVHRTLMKAADEHERFVAVVSMPDRAEGPKRISGVGDKVRLLKELRPRLKEQCGGLAFVLSAEAQEANAKSIRAGAKLWGCPTWATTDITAARTWAESQLPQGPEARS